MHGVPERTHELLEFGVRATEPLQSHSTAAFDVIYRTLELDCADCRVSVDLCLHGKALGEQFANGKFVLRYRCSHIIFSFYYLEGLRLANFGEQSEDGALLDRKWYVQFEAWKRLFDAFGLS